MIFAILTVCCSGHM